MPDTYWDNPPCPTPSLDGSGVESRGGHVFPNGRQETANSISGLPPQPTIIGISQGPGQGETFEPPDLTDWPAIVTK